MVTVNAGLAIPLNDSSEGTTPVGFRRALAVLFKQSAPGVAAPGRLGPDHFAVTGSSTAMEYNVSGGGLVIVRSATQGAYVIGNPDAVVVPTSPGDGVNPRIDIIYAVQPDPALDGSTVDVQLIIDVAQGSPAASPVAPSIPLGAVELARKVIAAGATNTLTGSAFSNVAPVTGLNIGGVLPVSEGGTGGTSEVTARNGLGIYDGSTAPAHSSRRIWVKVSS